MIKVCGSYVLVRPDAVESTTKSGIITGTRETLEKEQRAQVVGTIEQLGSGAWSDMDEGPWASVGDRVAYSKYGGKFLIDPDSGEEFVVLNDIDIVAVITEGETNE